MKKKIAVLTSGGDAPGMNAAVRAVVRSGLAKGFEIFGVLNGYSGLISGTFQPLRSKDVGGIIQQGGTFLGSARCPEFKTGEGRQTALDQLTRNGMGGLIVIGGNGSQAGALALSRMGFPVVGVASTIDNDLLGTEITIGVDTTLNVALEAIDRLKVTASSHERACLVEVMGRECGYLALMSGIAGGAEAIVIPEVKSEPEQVEAAIFSAHERGKRYALAVVAEGASPGAGALADYFKKHQERLGFELRVTILGHVQRGGSPGAFDRILATRFGVAAVEHFSQGNHGVLIGLLKGEVEATPLQEIAGKTKKPDLKLLETAGVLER